MFPSINYYISHENVGVLLVTVIINTGIDEGQIDGPPVSYFLLLVR